MSRMLRYARISTFRLALRLARFRILQVWSVEVERRRHALLPIFTQACRSEDIATLLVTLQKMRRLKRIQDALVAKLDGTPPPDSPSDWLDLSEEDIPF